MDEEKRKVNTTGGTVGFIHGPVFPQGLGEVCFAPMYIYVPLEPPADQVKQTHHFTANQQRALQPAK